MLGSLVLEVNSHSAENTRSIGRALGRWLRGGDIVLLSGGLGAGKTTLAQGIAAGLSIAGLVTSPTFALVNEYSGTDATGVPIVLAHIDLYRLGGDDMTLGLDDFIDAPDVVSVIEWPQVASNSLPDSALVVAFTTLDDSKRRLTFAPFGVASTRYTDAIAALRRELFRAAAH